MLDDLTSFLGRHGMTGIAADREEIRREFPSIIFSLFSIVNNRGCCSFIPSSSLTATSVFGIAIGGDGNIVSHSNLSTK